MPKVAARYLEVDPWLVVEKGFHPDRSRVSESIFSLGNEYMGVRGFFEEGYSGESLIGSFFNGVFDETDIGHPQLFKGIVTDMTFIVNAVNWLCTRITLDGETLDLARSKFSGFVRTLDLRAGTLAREFVWTTAKGRKLKITFLRFVSMAQAHLGAQRIVFEPLNFSGQVKVRAGLDFSIIHQEFNKNLWNEVKKTSRGNTAAILAGTLRSGHRVFSSMSLESDQPLSPRPAEQDKFIGLDLTLRLRQGQATRLDRIVVNTTERDKSVSDGSVWTKGMAACREIGDEIISSKTPPSGLGGATLGDATFDLALAEHEKFWRDVWSSLDVTIEGDAANQQGVRFCIFQLHQTYHGVDESLNVAAKGLTGEAYYGCAWWDTETYCLPFYMFNNPRAARNLLGFRHRTLAGAVERARQLDCRGARYPMCTIDGREICGTWQHGDLEIHISEAVTYGIFHYDRVVGDKDFLYNQGIEMLLQISRYYASRGAWSPKTGEFGLWGVMGPDEFHMMVHNNCYTNVMAQKTFEYTLEVIAEMRRAAPALLDKACRKVRLEKSEPAEWALKARKMRIPLDKKTGVFEQHDGYFDLPHVDVRKIPHTQFPIYKNWAYVRIFRGDMTKQPDVLLLMLFHSHDYSDRAKRVNYDYYEPRCSHESSLSPGIHALLAAELGKHAQAYEYSLHASRLDLDDYNRNTADGLHTTSMAAAWLNMVYGFGGMRSDGPTLSFNPSIPKKWKQFAFRILYKGCVLAVTVDKKNVSFRATPAAGQAGGEGVLIEVFGRRCFVGETGVSVPLPANRRA
jgi:maltose phosphorylase